MSLNCPIRDDFEKILEIVRNLETQSVVCHFSYIYACKARIDDKKLFRIMLLGMF